LLDGVEPEVIAAIHHAKHVPEVLEVRGESKMDRSPATSRARNCRHPELSVVEAQAIATAVREQLHHLSYLAEATVCIEPFFRFNP